MKKKFRQNSDKSQIEKKNSKKIQQKIKIKLKKIVQLGQLYTV